MPSIPWFSGIAYTGVASAAGAYATAKWEVKQFATPVSMRIDYPRTTVEPGASITPDQVVYVDANKVEKEQLRYQFC